MRGTLARDLKLPVVAGDHPRVCGEHAGTVGNPRCMTGSSPRMRGTYVWNLLAAQVLGIIPAYAGNITELSDFIGKNWDHPRVCGEHTTFFYFDKISTGSSPRMRGT